MTWRGFEDVTRRRRILLALLPFCILVIGMVPVLLDRVALGTAPWAAATVCVTATLDGEPWSGVLGFKVSGSEEWLGSMVPCEIRLPPGVYGMGTASGGPHDGVLRGVVPAASRYVGAGQTVTFTVTYDRKGT